MNHDKFDIFNFEMFLISEWFLKDHVTLKTEVMVT